MDRNELKERTRQFSLRVLRLSQALPKSPEGTAIRNQIVRCGTSVGANYRSACRSRSKKEFMARIGVCEEEADETLFWLELIRDAELLPSQRVSDLLQEANEIVAIMAATVRSARGGVPSLHPKSDIPNPK